MTIGTNFTLTNVSRYGYCFNVGFFILNKYKNDLRDDEIYSDVIVNLNSLSEI